MMARRQTGTFTFTGGAHLIEDGDVHALARGGEITDFEQLVGDGLAEVTAGVSCGTSINFGRRKYDAWVTVKLTCNQDEDTFLEASLAAQVLALEQQSALLDEIERIAEVRFPDPD